MTAATRSFGPTGQAGLAMSFMTATHGQTCAVHLIDRRTGRPHRINGRPLVLFTKAPEEAVAGLLAGRDASVWEVRVEPVGTATRTGGDKT